MVRGPVVMAVLLALYSVSLVQGQGLTMDFEDQDLQSIAMVLGQLLDQSITVYETVQGRGSFHFFDTEPQEALELFCRQYGLFARTQGRLLVLSRMELSQDLGGPSPRYSLVARNCDGHLILDEIQRVTGVNLVWQGSLGPSLTLRLSSMEPMDMIEAVVNAMGSFQLNSQPGHWTVDPKAHGSPAPQFSGAVETHPIGGKTLYQIHHRAGMEPGQVLAQLLQRAERDYLLGHWQPQILPPFNFSPLPLEELLDRLCAVAGLEWRDQDGIIEVGPRKQEEQTQVFWSHRLRSLNSDQAMAWIPRPWRDLVLATSGSDLLWIYCDPGQRIELEAILTTIDVPGPVLPFWTIDLDFIAAEELLAILPPSMAQLEWVVVDSGRALVVQAEAETVGDIRSFVAQVDRHSPSELISLSHVSAQELLAHPPEPLFGRSSPGPLENSIYIYGTAQERQELKRYLNYLDRGPQILGYRVLVFETVRHNSSTFTASLGAHALEPAMVHGLDGVISETLGLNFDLISSFGYGFALDLSLQLKHNQARLLMDTTLRGTPGEPMEFNNLSTYRSAYQGADDDSRPVIEEITSGLSLSITGHVEENAMVRSDVSFSLSRLDGEPSGGPLSTSERRVETTVRSRSGEPTVVGGLFQWEDGDEGRGLGYSRRESQTSEMRLYMIPMVLDPLDSLDLHHWMGELWSRFRQVWYP